jgi:Ni/Co efflux regulator RcnB
MKIMKTHFSLLRTGLLTLATLMTVTTAFADKPDWAGGGKGGGSKGNKQAEKHDDHNDKQRGSVEIRFGEDNRRIVNDYYGKQFKAGNCPPGLAKKNNGCQPPGQAKKWNKGRPLPHDLKYYDLPYDLARRLPPPPGGHRYVQVASDILMIAIGSNMVIDAIEDIGR